jgi:hypothetical protein
MNTIGPTVGSLKPLFRNDPETWHSLCDYVKRFMESHSNDDEGHARIESDRLKALSTRVSHSKHAMFAVTVSVLADLRLQGWTFQCSTDGIKLQRPLAQRNNDLERSRIQRMHAVNRDAQLLRESVRKFVMSMEKSRLGPNGWVSIFSLMRDGRELAGKLRKLTKLGKHEQIASLQGIIQPYMQVVTEESVCSYTGLRLGDVWRYFRLTWSNEYQTVPGRNLLLLVRDSSVENHPVIGIASLASPVVHLTKRDEWIGWAPRQFVEKLRENPTSSWAGWVEESVKSLLSEIHTEDLIKDRVISEIELRYPTEDTIVKLKEESIASRIQHSLFPGKALLKTPSGNVSDNEWLRRAESHLFRSKRCSTLAELLRAIVRLKNAGFRDPTGESLSKALGTSEGRQAIETIRKHIKAIHIGNNVLDISVCGAVSPYSDLVGGKLVAMLLTSPEIIHHYSQRYGKSSSIIASCMAGRKVSRRAKLTLLTTTSLYGSEPNQYTRIKIPVSEIAQDSEAFIEYKRLGSTRGQGSYHFSATTVNAIEVLISQTNNGRKVNSIFGEGVSPRLRKIRAGLDLCGFPTDAVLTHGLPRIVYGVNLTSDPLDSLVGRSNRLKYLVSQEEPKRVTLAISDYWRRRWLHPRSLRSEIIDRVAKHTLTKPVEHGARVRVRQILQDEMLNFQVD